MNHEHPHYCSYLLRLWQTSNGERQIWRASLESPGSGNRRGFASLDELFEFLAAQTEHEDDRDDCKGSSLRFQGGGKR